jgi:hypothetical protein
MRMKSVEASATAELMSSPRKFETGSGWLRVVIMLLAPLKCCIRYESTRFW